MTLISPVRDDLCIAFANTRSWRGRETPVERLHGVADLLAWTKRTGGEAGERIEQAGRWAGEHPDDADRLFDEAIRLREALYRALAAIAEKQAVEERDFAALAQAIAQAPTRSRLVRTTDGYAWHVGPFAASPAHLLAPVLWSAGDLIPAAARYRIRRCANPECRFLFLDESKSGTRRWCDMATCGNRAKASRHYAKVRQDAG
ncbi:CGNR zinc finger domain-containing protein [Labrys portucalensis]|uniref:ABATE domain-containing protein n=1 Tax=Labrys neptuniae TaxID=376174 RepID=A0ABV6ZEK5_9HYPH